MRKKPIKILAINPGSKYLGIAISEASDLKYWGIKVLKGKWSKEKIEKIKQILSDLINRYETNVLAIKKLHRSRSSANLNQLVRKIKEFSKRRGLKVYQYSLKDVKDFFSLGTKINKRQMAELVVSQYSFLTHPFEKEKRNKNPYFIRMFEAVALGIICFNQLDH
jgi:Holliday junction resolvasome RuvABC endonuclease subunit